MPRYGYEGRGYEGGRGGQERGRSGYGGREYEEEDYARRFRMRGRGGYGGYEEEEGYGRRESRGGYAEDVGQGGWFGDPEEHSRIAELSGRVRHQRAMRARHDLDEPDRSGRRERRSYDE